MKKTARLISVILAVIISAAVLGGCGQPAGQETIPPGTTQNVTSEQKEPLMGGEVVVGLAHDLGERIDPHNMNSAEAREVLFNIYEGLLKPTSDGELEFALVTDAVITGDELTFTLKSGVSFHDGSKMTAEDVVYSLERCMGVGQEQPLVSAFEAVQSVEMIDELTVMITLKEPSIEFRAYLTVPIIPVDSMSGEVNPPGTGPFKYLSSSPQENYIIEKFEDYHGTPAYLDKVTYKIIENPETMIMSLKSGAIDICSHLTLDQSMEFSEDPEWRVESGPMNLVQAVFLNNDVPPLNNVNVRRALSHAVNRQEIFDILNGGVGFPIGSNMLTKYEKYVVPELIDYYQYDVEKAKEMLAYEGYPNGFDLAITIPSSMTPHIATAQVIAEQLALIGIDVTIHLVDWSTWYEDAYKNRNYEATIIGLDATALTARSLLERFDSNHARDFINFRNDEYDQTLVRAISASDDAEQIRLYKRLQTILTEQAASLFIQDMTDFTVIKSGLQGPVFFPIFVLDMSSISYMG